MGTGLRRTICVAVGLAFFSIIGSSAGCRSEAAGQAVSLDRVPGIAALEYDGLDVIVRKGRTGAEGGWTLLVPGGAAAQEVFLRTGDQFLITDGKTFSEIYELLRPGEDEILFRREIRENRLEHKEGIRVHSVLVTVSPYGSQTKSDD